MSLLNERKVKVLNQSYMNAKQHQIEQANRKQKLLFRRLSVLLIFASMMVFFATKALLSQHEMMESKQAQLKTLEQQYQDLKHQESILQEEIVKLQDDEYIGKYARQEYFLSNDGEIIFSIPKEEDMENSD